MMKRTWYGILTLVLFFSSAAGLLAQTVLERLENQIRQRVGTEAVPGNPPAHPAPPGGKTALPSSENQPASGYLGVLADDRQDRGRGVRILDVYAGSPADKAGLRKQDLVTGLGDVRVRQMTDLADVLALYAPGETVELAVLRGGAPQKLKVTLGRPPERKIVARPAPEMIPAPVAQAEPGGPAVTPPGPPDLILPPPSEKYPVSSDETLRELQNRVLELERRVEQLERELAELRKRP
ncbi:MAG: PDZ domain-containing protein [Pirellulales bacterium]|nr:PDZ domain-containing protein [Pirellulales bacterium]